MVPRNLRPLLPYFKKYRGGFVLGALCVLLNNGTWVLFPKVIQKAIDGLSHQISYHQLMLYSLLLVGIALTKGVFQFLTRWILIGISREIEFDLRNDLSTHISVICDRPETAAALAQILTLWRNSHPVAPTSSPNVSAFLEGLDISADGARVELRGSGPSALLDELGS